MLTLELVAGMKTVSRSSPGHLSFATCKSRVVICNHSQRWEGGRLSAMKCVTKRALTQSGRSVNGLLSYDA